VTRPWRKRSAWPYVAKSGRRSYRVGFYDHDKRERTKSFPSAGHARLWMYDYVTAERRGRDSLRRFLLDLDAKEANEAEGRTIAEIVELFLETDAHQRNEEGSRARHLRALHLGAEQPSARQAAQNAGEPAQTAGGGLRSRDRRGPRGALQLAADTPGLAGADAPGGRAALDSRPSMARALLRAELGVRLGVGTRDRDERVPPGQRARSQPTPIRTPRRDRLRARGATAPAGELGALTAGCRGDPRADAPRRRAMRRAPRPPGRDVDFIVPGDLTGAGKGVRDPATGAVHLSRAQAKKRGQTRFKPAVGAVARRTEFASVVGATPYALRRGGISLRLRTEDPQIVASECGASLKMLSDHYSFPIEDPRHHEPRPADLEWRAARAALSGQDAREREPRRGLFARVARRQQRGLQPAGAS
jgi:hypothetical protein